MCKNFKIAMVILYLHNLTNTGHKNVMVVTSNIVSGSTGGQFFPSEKYNLLDVVSAERQNIVAFMFIIGRLGYG